MDFGLTDDQQDIQRAARDMLADRAKWERVREHAEAETTDEGLWREVSELGWPGIAVAEEFGGQGLGTVELAILCEELGRTVAPVPFLPTIAAAALISAGGSDEQRAHWLPGLADGSTPGAVADARDGVAELVIGGANAQVFVLAEGDEVRVLGPDEVVVERRPSIDPTRPSARVTARDGAGQVLTGDVAAGLDRALIAVAAELVGICDAALAMTVEYVKDRKQFGTPVGAYQAVSHRCAQMLLDTEKARSAVSFAAWAADSESDRLGEAAAMAKAAASDAGREVTASAIQAHGGIGFTWEADVHWLFKRAQVDAVYLGGAKHQRARLARIVGGRMSAPAAA